MKKHNLFKVVMITFAVVVLLSWIFDVTAFTGYGVTEGEKMQIGLLSIPSYLSIALQYFGHIGLYVLMVGGFYGVLHKIPAYRNLIDRMVNGFKGYEYLFMIIVMVVFTLLSSIAGLSVATILFFPFVIAVILAMGYDKITAALITVGSISVGLIGTLYSDSNINGVTTVLGVTSDSFTTDKVVLLLISFALLVFNVLWYARSHRDTENIVKGSYIPEKSTDVKQKIWPLVALMDFMLVFLTVAFVSWSTFKIDIFSKVHTKLLEYTIFDFPLFKNVLGLTDKVYLGNWTLVEAIIVIIIVSMIVAFVYKMKLNDYITSFMNGAKRALKAAVLVILSYIILIGVTNVPTLMTIFKHMFELTEDMNVFTMSIASFITCLFNGDTYYSAIAILPYVSNVTYPGVNVEVLSVLFQSMYGLATLVAPTSVVLLATLSYMHIPYGKWLKAVWKLLLELFVVLAIALFIIAAIV